MDPILIQIIFRQWDKGQRSETEQQRRAALPDRYALDKASSQTLLEGRVILDCRGEDRLGNRLQYQLATDHLWVDRFCVDLNRQQVGYYDDVRMHSLKELSAPWTQWRYQWRYRVHESDMIYWLYEEVIFNIAPSAPFEAKRFISCAPAMLYNDLPGPASTRPYQLAVNGISLQ